MLVADSSHEKYVDTILQTIADAAKVRGTGIAKRTHEYLATKMKEAKAVIAVVGEGAVSAVILIATVVGEDDTRGDGGQRAGIGPLPDLGTRRKRALQRHGIARPSRVGVVVVTTVPYPHIRCL